MMDVGGAIVEAIAAFAKRAREEAERQNASGAAPVGATPARRVSAPQPAARTAAVIQPAKRAVAPPSPLSVPFELPGSELFDAPLASESRRPKRPATGARANILALLSRPNTLAAGIIISEVLAPPLSLRPPRNGPGTGGT